MNLRPAWGWCGSAVLVGSALGLQWARADVPTLARLGALSIDLAEFSRRALVLAPFQRARLGASWPEQRRRLLEELARERLLEAEASRSDRQLSSPRDAALAQALLAELQRGAATAAVSPERIADYYAERRQSYEAPRAILIWRILLPQEAAARELLRELGKPTEAGWSRLARERSIDRATHMRAGSLGYVAADGQTHMPQVRVSRALFAAADQVQDGELVPQPVAEGDAFAVVWRRASRAARPDQRNAVGEDVAAVLAGEAFAKESSVLLEQLRSAELRDYQPERLEGFESRSDELLGSPRVVPSEPVPRRTIAPAPRPTDSGLR